MKTKNRIGILAVLLTAGLLVQDAWSADTLANVREKGMLVVGVRGDAPPFGFIDRDTGEPVGIDVDLAREIANRLGVQTEFRTVTAAGWIPELVNGNVDLVAAAVSGSPEREKLVDFSAAYFATAQQFIAKKGTVATLKDLEGKRIGTGQDLATEENVRKAVPKAACYYFRDTRKALEALQRGEVDALSASGAHLYGCLSALPKGEYEVPGSIRIGESGYRMAVRKGEDRLLGVVNAVLAEVRKEGTAQKIFDKWLADSIPQAGVATPQSASKAVGVVTRATPTSRRYLVLPVSGTFVPGAALSIYDPDGHRLGSGKVERIYEDEMYVDALDVPEDMVRPGFLVTMNYEDNEAGKIVLSYNELVEKVKEDVRKEEQSIQKQIAEEYLREKKEREKFQEEMAKARMNLDYQYSTYYYSPYPFYNPYFR